MIKLISVVLSFSLLFMSVAPSYAQAVSQERNNALRQPPAVRDNTRVAATERLAFETRLETEMREQQRNYVAAFEVDAFIKYLEELSKLGEASQGKTEEELDAQRDADMYKAFKEMYLADLKKEYEKQKKLVKGKKELERLTELYWEYTSEQVIRREWESATGVAFEEAVRAAENEAEREFKNKAAEVARLVCTDLKTSEWVEKVYPLLAMAGLLPEAERKWGRGVLREQLAVSGDACAKSNPGEDDKTKCEAGIGAVAALGAIGQVCNGYSDADLMDVEAIEAFLKKGLDGAFMPSVLMVSGAALLSLNGYGVLSSLFHKKAAQMPDVGLFSGDFAWFSFESWVKVIGSTDFSDFFNDNSAPSRWLEMVDYGGTYPISGEKRQGNAWMDLAEYVGRVASGAEEGVSEQEKYGAGEVARVISENTLKILNRGAGIRVEFPYALAGLLIGGYKPHLIGFKGPALNKYGKIVEMNTADDWAKMNASLKAHNTELTEWALGAMFYNKKLDLDPWTRVEINNRLAETETALYGVARAAALGMTKRSGPSSKEINSWEGYQDWLSIGNSLDWVITIASVLFLGAGLVKGAMSGVKMMSSLGKMMRVTRAGLKMSGVAASRLGVLRGAMKVMLRQKYGTSSFVGVLRVRHGGQFVLDKEMQVSLVGGMRNWRTGQIAGYLEETRGLMGELRGVTNAEAAEGYVIKMRGLLSRAQGMMKEGVANKKLCKGFISQIEGVIAEAEGLQSQIITKALGPVEITLVEKPVATAVTAGEVSGGAAAPAGKLSYQGTARLVTNPSGVYSAGAGTGATVPGQSFTGYTLSKPSFMQEWKGSFLDWLQTTRYEVGDIFSQSWRAFRNGSKSMLLSGYLMFAPVADLGGGLRTESALLRGVPQIEMVSNFARGTGFVSELGNGVRSIAGAAEGATALPRATYLSYMPSVVTPEMERTVLGRFWGGAGSNLFGFSGALQSYNKLNEAYTRQFAYQNGQYVGPDRYAFSQYLQRQQTYDNGNFAIKRQWDNLGYPLSGTFYAGLQNIKDAMYVNFVAPWSLKDNSWYLAYQAAVAQQNAQAAASARAQESVREQEVADFSATESGDMVPAVVPVRANSSLTLYSDPFLAISSFKGLVKAFQWIGSKIFNRYSQSIADSHAKSVLAIKQPLVTELKSILASAASVQYKKQALLRLHVQFNAFADEKLPESARTYLDELTAAGKEREAELADDLYQLYISQAFAKSLAALNNHIPDDQISKMLQMLIADPSFAAQSQAVYDSTPVLSVEMLDGAVRSLQGVDINKILAASRTASWAAANASNAGVEEKGGWIAYENDIPVYYRNSKGQLSEAPIAILHQNPSSWYASLLASVGLSTKKGFKVPKGMVLALDENGKFKYVRQPGHLKELEDSPAGRDTQNATYAQGSQQVQIDTPYSTTDLLAIAKILETNPGVSFQLTLNEPNSFKPFINLLGAFIGTNLDAIMVSPFKKAASASDSPTVQAVAPNAFGGVGYDTPRAAGELVPHMQEWGMDKSTFAVLAVSLATLIGSWMMGINGITPTGDFSLAALAVPMVVIVLAASLMRSSAPLLLNHYKDPTMRTAANLKMSTWQQFSKVIMAGITFGATALGGNAFIVIPAATVLALVTIGLFLNTPMGKNVLASFGAELKNPGQIGTDLWHGAKVAVPSLAKGLVLGAVSPITNLYNWLVSKFTSNKQTYAEDDQGRYRKQYDEDFINNPQDHDNKDALQRVTLAYASYAASIMVLNQMAGAFFGDWGQAAVTLFAIASLFVRNQASNWVGSGKFTDDQLTGISFAGLALMPLLLAGVTALGPDMNSISGIIELGLFGLFGIILNMSTAVPGQLDNTRLQNNVTAALLNRKTAVLQDPALSEDEKQAQIADLEKMEKAWAGWASKDYSKANANGMIGVYAAVIASGLLSVFAPTEWSVLTAIAVFVYAGLVASLGAFKTRHMAGSFLGALFKKNKQLHISEEDIASGSVSYQTFGVPNDPKKAQTVMVTLMNDKKTGISALRARLNPYGGTTLVSEVKMVGILSRMIEIHNRLVAVAEVMGVEAVQPAFEALRELALEYQNVLAQNEQNLSVALTRHFNTLAAVLAKEGDLPAGVAEKPGYMSEGDLDLLANHEQFLQAQELIKELEVLAKNIKQGGSAVQADTYRLFVNYRARTVTLLNDYSVRNPSESGKAREMFERVKYICLDLKKSQAWTKDAGPTSKKDIEALQDVLNLYEPVN